jgi:two-component system chemotaxis sensor kinase CheA
LIVDDSPFFRHLLSPLLQQAGYPVTSVESAERALELKDDGNRFDLIVSDIDMPGMDGFEFAEAVKASAEWSETPLVALSGQTRADWVERGHRAGFRRCAGKTDRDGLLNTLLETLADVRESL